MYTYCYLRLFPLIFSLGIANRFDLSSKCDLKKHKKVKPVEIEKNCESKSKIKILSEKKRLNIPTTKKKITPSHDGSLY